MKLRILLLFAIVFDGKAYSQAPNPDCSSLLVSQVQMDTDTADLIKVTVKNTCANCATGINGCVYLEMRVIRTVAPFDTIAATKCYCHYHAPNGGQRTFLLFDSQVTVLPPLDQIRVSIPNCGCDTIPYEAELITGIESPAYPGVFSIRQLSALEYELSSPQGSGNYEVSIKDITGKRLGSLREQEGNTKLNLGAYVPGVYLVEIYDNKANILKVFKVIKP